MQSQNFFGPPLESSSRGNVLGMVSRPPPVDRANSPHRRPTQTTGGDVSPRALRSSTRDDVRAATEQQATSSAPDDESAANIAMERPTTPPLQHIPPSRDERDRQVRGGGLLDAGEAYSAILAAGLTRGDSMSVIANDTVRLTVGSDHSPESGLTTASSHNQPTALATGARFGIVGQPHLGPHSNLGPFLNSRMEYPLQSSGLGTTPLTQLPAAAPAPAPSSMSMDELRALIASTTAMCTKTAANADKLLAVSSATDATVRATDAC